MQYDPMPLFCAKGNLADNAVPRPCYCQPDRNLFDCIRDEDLVALRIYVERDGPVHVADALGETSLLVAASTGNVELMKVGHSTLHTKQLFQS